MSNKNMKKPLIVALAIFACAAAGVGYYLSQPTYDGGTIEISFDINDPEKFPDDEPLQDPQTVVWIEDAGGKYVRSVLVSDWTAQIGWKKMVKLADGTKVKEMCPQWQRASGWPKNHSKKVVDAVSKATPETGPNKITVKCANLKLTAGTYRYRVQTSVAEVHSILYTGTITVGGGAASESAAKVEYLPEKHPDAGDILSNVKATYKP